MDFLVAALSPALTKTLEVCFITGYATCYHIESAKRLKGGLPNLPRLRQKPSRQFLRTSSSSLSPGSVYRTGSSGGSSKALPNDPQRQGNIWHRYEQLENATKSLSNVNQQLGEERALHKKEKKRLEDAIIELQMLNEQLQRSGSGKPNAVLSEESKALMRELMAPEDSKELIRELSETRQELQRLTEEMSDAHNQLEFLRSENQSLATDNAALQRKVAGEPIGRRRPSVVGAGAAPATPFAKDGPSVATFADEVASVAASKMGVPSTERSHLASFGSDIEANVPTDSLTSTRSSSDLSRTALASANATTPPAQAAALQAENKLLKEKLAALKSDVVVGGAIGGGTFVGSTTILKNLQEQNTKLMEENQRLQNKILRVNSEPARAQDLEEKYNKLLEENTRLQSKVVRLNLGAAPAANTGDAAMIEELREENAELREDNDKLVVYLEGLERKKKDLEEYVAQAQAAQGGVSAVGELGQFVQLKTENRRLLEEVAKLRKRLEDNKLGSTGSFQTVPIPVHVETGEEMDKDLWMLVEELRDQNRGLIEELDALRAGGKPPQATADQTTETDGEDTSKIADLQRQLNTVMESRAAEINDDNIRLVNRLSDENAALQEELMRLNKKLSVCGSPADAEVLRETISSSERLLAEKQEVEVECRRLADKNTRLIKENERLLKQLSLPENPIRPGDILRSAGSFGSGGTPVPQQRGLFSKLSKGFRRKSSRESRDFREEDELVPSSTEASASSNAGAREQQAKESLTTPRQLVQELIDENSKLLEESKRLAASASNVQELGEANQKLQEENQRFKAGMGLVKELTAENAKLAEANQQLTDSVNKFLTENREVTGHTEDAAFQSEDAMFDAAFGGETPSPGAKAPVPSLTTQNLARAHQQLAEQMRQAEEQRKADAGRREELTTRATDQLNAYERAASSTAPPKRSPSSAIARLSSLNQKASEVKAASKRPSSRGNEPMRPELSSQESTEGSSDEASRRQKEANLARAELHKKIEASRKKREGGSSPGTRPSSADASGDGRETQMQSHANDRVRQIFQKHAKNDNLGAFMRAVGFSGFPSNSSREDENELLNVFQLALSTTTEILRDPARSAEEKAVARAVNSVLQEWYAQYSGA